MCRPPALEPFFETLASRGSQRDRGLKKVAPKSVRGHFLSSRSCTSPPVAQFEAELAVRILPKFEFVIVKVGVPRLTQLKTLKNSPLNSSLWLSLILKVRNNPMSMFLLPGPLIMFRPALPRVPGGLASNAAVLNHGLPAFASVRRRLFVQHRVSNQIRPVVVDLAVVVVILAGVDPV